MTKAKNGKTSQIYYRVTQKMDPVCWKSDIHRKKNMRMLKKS